MRPLVTRKHTCCSFLLEACCYPSRDVHLDAITNIFPFSSYFSLRQEKETLSLFILSVR